MNPNKKNIPLRILVHFIRVLQMSIVISWGKKKSRADSRLGSPPNRLLFWVLVRSPLRDIRNMLPPKKLGEAGITGFHKFGGFLCVYFQGECKETHVWVHVFIFAFLLYSSNVPIAINWCV